MPSINKKMALVTFATPEFYLGVKVLLNSFLEYNNSFSRSIDFVLITNDVDFFKDTITGSFRNIVIKKVQSENYNKIFEKFSIGRLQAAFYKLDVFLLEEYDQIVFVDSDTLIQGSITELFYQKDEFAAVPDFALRSVKNRNVLQNSVTFNSGLMVIPKKYLNINTYKNILCSTLSFDYIEHADNEVLSSYFTKYEKLSYRFNTCSMTCPMQGSMSSSAKILHFAGIKPWHIHGDNIHVSKWRQYCSKKEIFDIGIEHRYDLPRLLNELGLNGLGAEIGVQYGLFSDHILRQWKGRLLYSIDPWVSYQEGIVDYSNVSVKCQEIRYEKCRILLQEHGHRSEILRLTSEEASYIIDDKSLDFVYIDARHDYEAVKKDISFWEPKVKKGGIIAGHDYINGHRVVKGNVTNFGVKRAVDEIFGKNNIKVTKEKDYRTWLYLK